MLRRKTKGLADFHEIVASPDVAATLVHGLLDRLSVKFLGIKNVLSRRQTCDQSRACCSELLTGLAELPCVHAAHPSVPLQVVRAVLDAVVFRSTGAKSRDHVVKLGYPMGRKRWQRLHSKRARPFGKGGHPSKVHDAAIVSLKQILENNSQACSNICVKGRDTQPDKQQECADTHVNHTGGGSVCQ